jgi:hypothetical protein
MVHLPCCCREGVRNCPICQHKDKQFEPKLKQAYQKFNGKISQVLKEARAKEKAGAWVKKKDIEQGPERGESMISETSSEMAKRASANKIKESDAPEEPQQGKKPVRTPRSEGEGSPTKTTKKGVSIKEVPEVRETEIEEEEEEENRQRRKSGSSSSKQKVEEDIDERGSSDPDTCSPDSESTEIPADKRKELQLRSRDDREKELDKYLDTLTAAELGQVFANICVIFNAGKMYGEGRKVAWS